MDIVTLDYVDDDKACTWDSSAGTLESADLLSPHRIKDKGGNIDVGMYMSLNTSSPLSEADVRSRIKKELKLFYIQDFIPFRSTIENPFPDQKRSIRQIGTYYLFETETSQWITMKMIQEMTSRTVRIGEQPFTTQEQSA